MLTASEVRAIFIYDSETGSIVWRNDRFGSNGARRAIAGKEAGYINVRGYRAINLNGREYLAHRLAWIYVHGEWPSEQIDHINRVRDDNRIANLRTASHAENMRNRGALKNSQSGIRGVRYLPQIDKWMARIRVNGTLIHLGCHPTAKSAKAAYDAAAKTHFGEFYGEASA